MRIYFRIEWIHVGTNGPIIEELIDGTSEYGYKGENYSSAFGKMLKRAHELYMTKANTLKVWKINQDGSRTIFSHEQED